MCLNVAKPKLVLLFSGKRKCGKDYLTALLLPLLVILWIISFPKASSFKYWLFISDWERRLPKWYESRNQLNLIGPRKRVWIWTNCWPTDLTRRFIERKWSNGVTVFVLKIMDTFAGRPWKEVDSFLGFLGMHLCLIIIVGISHVSAQRPVVVVSDIRRRTDIEYFKNTYNIKTIRIEAVNDVRQQRGWTFENGVDNVQSECDLDDFEHWDFRINNDGTDDINLFLTQIADVIRNEISNATWLKTLNDLHSV